MNSIISVRGALKQAKDLCTCYKQIAVGGQRHHPSSKIALWQTYRKSFASKKESKDLDSNAWIPPSHSPVNFSSEKINENETGKTLIGNNSSSKLDENSEVISEYIDLDEIDLDIFLKAQKGLSDDEFMGGNIEVSDDVDQEEIMKYMEQISEIVDDLDLENVNEISDENEIPVVNDDLKNEEEALEKKLQAIEKRMKEENTKEKNFSDSSTKIDDFIESSSSSTPDWLQTRKKASLLQHPSATIDVKHHTLLTSEEIMGCLSALGGMNVKLIQSKFTAENLFIEGMIIATGHNTSHLRTMSSAIVKALKERKLAEKGVIGAEFGPEDGDDWIAIDAENYVVHIMDDVVRKSTNLEKLWGDEEVDDIRKVDLSNDEMVEDFVRDNPIPDEYAKTFFKEEEYGRYTGSNELGKYKFKAWEEEMKRKERLEKLNRRVKARKKRKSKR